MVAQLQSKKKERNKTSSKSKWERQPILLLSAHTSTHTHSHTHKQTEIQPHTTEDHKSLSWICNLIAVRNSPHPCVSPRTLCIWFFNASVLVETSLHHLLNTLQGAFLKLVFYSPLRPWNIDRWEQGTVITVVYLSPWFLSVCVYSGWWKPVSNWFSWYFLL